EGFMALIPTTTEDGDLEPGDVSWCRVRVLHEGRRLTMLHRDLGFGPLLVMVEDPRLSPPSDFRDVVDDEHVVDLCETLRAVASALVEALCTSFVRLPAAMQRWLGKALLLRAASDGVLGNRTMLDRVRELPLLPTVDDDALSVSDAEALVERHGKLE